MAICLPLWGGRNSDIDLQRDDLEGIAPRRRYDTPFAAGTFPDDGRRLEDSAGGALDPDRLLEDRESRPVGQGAVGEVGEEEGEVFRLDRAKDPDDRKVINVAYRYTRANPTLINQAINQVLLSTEWPLTRRLYAVGRFNYDLQGHRLVDGLVGFQYDADCWVLGVGAQRYANGLNSSGQHSSSTHVLAQLTLKGFTTVDNGLVAAFRAGVAGYQEPPPPPPPLARFTNYE